MKRVIIIAGIILAILAGAWTIACFTCYEPTLIAQDEGKKITVQANFPLSGQGKIYFSYHCISLNYFPFDVFRNDVTVGKNQVDAVSGQKITVTKPEGANCVRIEAEDRALLGPGSKYSILNW